MNIGELIIIAFKVMLFSNVWVAAIVGGYCNHIFLEASLCETESVSWVAHLHPIVHIQPPSVLTLAVQDPPGFGKLVGHFFFFKKKKQQQTKLH